MTFAELWLQPVVAGVGGGTVNMGGGGCDTSGAWLKGPGGGGGTTGAHGGGGMLMSGIPTVPEVDCVGMTRGGGK